MSEVHCQISSDIYLVNLNLGIKSDVELSEGIWHSSYIYQMTFWWIKDSISAALFRHWNILAKSKVDWKILAICTFLAGNNPVCISVSMVCYGSHLGIHTEKDAWKEFPIIHR